MTAFTRETYDPARDPAIGTLTHVDWQAFKNQAHFHRVEGLIARALITQKHHFETTVPHSVWAHFKTQMKSQAINGLTRHQHLRKILSAFEDQNLPVILMKGEAISQRYYTARTDRQSIDIDLLVSEADFHNACELLNSCGFEQTYPNVDVCKVSPNMVKLLKADITFMSQQGRICVELHRRLNANPYLLPWGFDTVFGHSELLHIEGQNVRVLSAPALCVYLMCHGAKHSWFRLKWLTDIERLTQSFSVADWEAVIRLAQSADISQIVTASLKLLDIVYRAPLPLVVTEYFQLSQPSFLYRYSLKKIVAVNAVTSIKFRDLGDVFQSLVYQARLRPKIAYLAINLIHFLIDIRDVERLKRSRKWLWFYLIYGPFSALSRILSR